MKQIFKCKLIGDGKAKPFWADLNEVNGALKLCREFMAKYIFPKEYHNNLREIFDLIDHGFGVQAFQDKCGYDGQVVERVYDRRVKKSWQRGKRRIYNVYMDKYKEEGYFQVPHLRTIQCRIKDKSGIHCKDRYEIARIFMDKIVCRYFFNTVHYARLHDNFELTFVIKSGESYVVIDPRYFLRTLFEVDLLYQKYTEHIMDAYDEIYDKAVRPLLQPLTTLGLLTGGFMRQAFKRAYIHGERPIGNYTFSAITAEDYTFHIKYDEGDPQYTEFGDDHYLHLFDVISEFTKQIKNDGQKPKAFHFSFDIDPRYWPSEYVNSLERIEANG